MSTENPAGQPSTPAFVERRESRPRYHFANGVWIILGGAAQTSGRITNMEAIYNRGGGLPAYTRVAHTEFAYVIAGRLSVQLGAQNLQTANCGSLVYIPPGIPRRLTADEDGTRVYYGLVPAGAEDWIIRAGTPAEDMQVRISSPPIDVELAASFGVIVHPG